MRLALTGLLGRSWRPRVASRSSPERRHPRHRARLPRATLWHARSSRSRRRRGLARRRAGRKPSQSTAASTGRFGPCRWTTAKGGSSRVSARSADGITLATSVGERSPAASRRRWPRETTNAPSELTNSLPPLPVRSSLVNAIQPSSQACSTRPSPLARHLTAALTGRRSRGRSVLSELDSEKSLHRPLTGSCPACTPGCPPGCIPRRIAIIALITSFVVRPAFVPSR